MKRCYEGKNVKDVTEKFIESLGDETNWELVGMFQKEYEKFLEEHDVEELMIFEAGECQDEEFGMVLVETGYDEYEWKIVYLAGNNGQIALVL